MYNVAICDDTEEERLQAAEYAGRFFEREGIEVRIDTYAAGRELLESGREYDLYLLDVLMPGMSGIDTAQALAEDKDHPVVVFITSSLESAVEGYRVEAAGFILKPGGGELLGHHGACGEAQAGSEEGCFVRGP